MGKETQRRLFRVWAGKDGKYAEPYVEGEYVAIEWPNAAELHAADSYEALRRRATEAWAKEPPGRFRNLLGQANTFLLRIRISDLVLIPSADRRQLRLGEVISHPFRSSTGGKSRQCAYRRKVEWGARIHRSELPEAVQDSLRSPLPVFQIRGADSWTAETAGGLLPAQDETVGPGGSTPRPVEVCALEGYRIWLRYDDGASGEVDLSRLAGKGVFAAWSDRGFFESVRLADYGAVVWSDEVDICPDSLYMDITGKTVAELMPKLLGSPANA